MSTAYVTAGYCADTRRNLIMEVAMMLVLGAAGATATAQERSALPPLPPGARQFAPSAGALSLNGMSTRLNGFLSSSPIHELAHWYRQQLGGPLAENRIGQRQILGKEHDGHYVTIQLDPVPGGTRGVVAVASTEDMHRHQAREQESRDMWRNRLPAGSQLLSYIRSVDTGQEASFIAFANRHDEILNQESLKRLMREDGLELERKVDAETVSGPGRGRQGTALYFKGGAREATATVFRTADDRIAVVLNIIKRTGNQ